MIEIQAPVWVWPITAGVIVAAVAVFFFLRTLRMRTVFVSYRRADSSKETEGLVDSLARRFGRRRVFRDVVSIYPGENFREAITRTIRKCDAAVVVIGTDWTTCKEADGTLRLLKPDDVVRNEVAGVLDSGTLVIPVLVRGAEMPARQNLPPDLQGLSDLQAVPVEDNNYDVSLSRLVEAIVSAPVRRTPLFLFLCHTAVFVLLWVFYLVYGLTLSQFTTSLAIVCPALAATGAVMLMNFIGTAGAPARFSRVSPASLFLPLMFVSAIALLVVLKTLNIRIDSFETFKLFLGAIELLFGGYTGLVLASIFENRRIS
jgi:hypothetical protein